MPSEAIRGHPRACFSRYRSLSTAPSAYKKRVARPPDGFARMRIATSSTRHISEMPCLYFVSSSSVRRS